MSKNKPKWKRWSNYPKPTSVCIEVSEDGRVRADGVYLPLTVTRKGYKRVNIKVGKGRTIGAFVYRLVAECFLPRIYGHRFVDHRDRCKSNDHRDNLRWATASINIHNRDKVNKRGKPVGVYFNTRNNTWDARIMVNLRHIWLGRFTTQAEAIKARQEAEKRYLQ